MAQNTYYQRNSYAYGSRASGTYAYGSAAPDSYMYGSTAPQPYVYGNAVPKQDYDRQRRAERDARARERNAVQQKGRRAAQSMDLPYILALTVASIITLFIFVNYLQVQSQITTSIKNIEAQETLLEGLKTDNDALESRIEAGINLDEIYRVATEELGMVYANKDQVVTYDRTPTEYVKQNEDITE